MDQISESAAEGSGAHSNASHALPPRSLALYAADRADEHFPAVVLRREPGFYLLQIGTPLAEGRKLIMVDGAFRFELEVMSWRPNETGGFAIGCKVLACSEGTVRQEWRIPVNIPAKVSGPAAAPHVYSARVRDLSPFGMGVELPVEVERNASLTVATRDGFGYGEVRYCRRLPNGRYFAGLYVREYLQKQGSAAHYVQGVFLRIWNCCRGLMFPVIPRKW